MDTTRVLTVQKLIHKLLDQTLKQNLIISHGSQKSTEHMLFNLKSAI